MPDKKNIGIVKRRLWSSGYSVGERSRAIDGFDLLVEGKYKICVYRRKAPIETVAHDTTIAIVDFDLSKRPIVVYVGAPNFSNPTVSPRGVFGLPASKSKDYGNKKEGKAKGN